MQTINRYRSNLDEGYGGLDASREEREGASRDSTCPNFDQSRYFCWIRSAEDSLTESRSFIARGRTTRFEAVTAPPKSVKAHYAQNQFGSNSCPCRATREVASLNYLAISLSLSLTVIGGRIILASLARIRARLILLTVEGRGLTRRFKRRRRPAVGGGEETRGKL